MKKTATIIKQYEMHLINEEKSAATIQKYIHDISSFYAWLENQKLTKETVLCYKQKLMKSHAVTSVNSVLCSLNGFFTYIGRHDLKMKNLKIQKKIFCQSEKELTKDEYKRLLTAAKIKKNERLYLIMQTICATGIRVSELSCITCEAVHAGSASVRLKGKIRVILLNKDLCRMLQKYIKKQGITKGCVFVTRHGNPIDRHAIWKAMKALCNDANISKEKVFPHNLRHLFARTYYATQKDIVRLADILGHSSVNTTRIYTIETGEECRKQIENLGLCVCGHKNTT